MAGSMQAPDAAGRISALLSLLALRQILAVLQPLLLLLLLPFRWRARQVDAALVADAVTASSGKKTKAAVVLRVPAKRLNAMDVKVYGMDWTGHGGSDGLHGYVQSLDHAVEDMKMYLKKISAENPGVPCFCFGHSTGGGIILKTDNRRVWQMDLKSGFH